ncbi:MAG: enoyl-CoA hydratase [Comamonadaceae bacterium]|nr:MAG: enoyl-CoA hydratase [Comamonadaceae bacterium]
MSLDPTIPIQDIPAGIRTAAVADVLQSRDERGVYTITLNRPASFNSLGESMLAALQQALEVVKIDPQARAVVIAAAGKAFCAGHDLKEMNAHPSLDFYQALFSKCSRVMMSIQNLPVPVIAKVQGLATAAGCQLVAQADLAVAAENARFGVNGIDVGLFCATPSVPLVRNMPAKQAMEMLLTGDFIDAHEAVRRGLVNRVVPADALDAEVERLLQSLVAKPREAVAIGKALFYRQRETGVEAAYQLAGQAMATNMMEAVAQEGVEAFIAKRKPVWQAPSTS